jgi:hypothetical protein
MQNGGAEFTARKHFIRQEHPNMPHSPARKKLLLSLAVLVSTLWQHPLPAQAQNSAPPTGVVPVVFKPQVPFSADAQISEPIRQQCGLNEAMVASIQKYATEFAVPLVNGDPVAEPGKAVRELSAEIIHATPGVYIFFHWGTRPAILAVHYKLTEGDRVLLETTRSCSSRKAGFLGLDGHACAKLNECVDEQGGYIGKLIKKRFY